MLRSSKACLPHLKLSTKWCVSTWMGDHLGTVSGWSAEHCGVTGQCKDSGVGNRGTHLFLCNGKEMSLCPAHASCKTTHHLSYFQFSCLSLQPNQLLKSIQLPH